MSLRRRLKWGTVANSANLVYVSILQLVSLPVLTHAWGVERYGQWLMLATIPSYLALADFGFGQAATSDMTMRIARGDRRGALVTFQSIWVFVMLVATAVILLSSFVFVAGLPFADVVFLLVVYTAVCQYSWVVLAGFRSSGHYARGTLVYNTMWFCEWLLVPLVGWLGGDILQCTLALLASRVVITVALYRVLRISVPWLSLGYGAAKYQEVRRLAKPALGALAIPSAVALNLQGMVLVVGAVISPTAAATFAAVRTISRLTTQIVGTFNRASMPEMSAAHATGRKDAIVGILLANAASVLFLVVPGAILFALFGGKIVEIWSHGAVRPEATFVTLMAVGIVTHCVWTFASNLLLATNAHGRLALIAICCAVLLIPAAVVGARLYGLDGAALALIAADIVCSTGAIILVRNATLVSLSESQQSDGEHGLPTVESRSAAISQ